MAAPGPESTQRHRHVVMELNTTVGELSKVPGAKTASVTLSPEQLRTTFGVRGYNKDAPTERNCNLGAVRFTKMNILQSNVIESPWSLAVNFPQLSKGNSYVSGQRCAAVVSKGIVVAERNLIGEIGGKQSEFGAKFPGFTAGNVATKGVTYLDDASEHLLVSANHPATDTALKSSELSGLACVRQSDILPGYVTMNKAAFDVILNDVRSKMLESMPDKDLSKGLTMEVSRADGLAWDDKSGRQLAKNAPVHLVISAFASFIPN